MPLILIGGGTASGKTSVAERITGFFKGDALTLSMDRYYLDLSNIPIEERARKNFDDPIMIDWKLLEEQILLLKQGKSIIAPTHDYKSFNRGPPEALDPKKIIIVEGIFALYKKEIRAIADLCLFVDSPPDVRLLRRMRRDIKERGRSVDEVYERWMRFVQPSHEKYVEPTKKFAHLILPEDPEDRWREKAINVLCNGLSNL